MGGGHKLGLDPAMEAKTAGKMIVIRDIDAALYGLDLTHCRIRIRDEDRRLTYVEDRFLIGDPIRKGVIHCLPEVID